MDEYPRSNSQRAISRAVSNALGLSSTSSSYGNRSLIGVAFPDVAHRDDAVGPLVERVEVVEVVTVEARLMRAPSGRTVRRGSPERGS